ncbi:hypothetical protein PBY51_015607 [Eleginops maclovinus]|uniref:Uncharacterized protein n=1 Tax=Eleginops maclovinus TaxID=56733 RepID=A0AAN8ALG6_ELEMC|nr:hypothetical protein PBY51_015607 [Eleginops maclovinus]
MRSSLRPLEMTSAPQRPPLSCSSAATEGIRRRNAPLALLTHAGGRRRAVRNYHHPLWIYSLKRLPQENPGGSKE